jgi:hypothetical protein
MQERYQPGTTGVRIAGGAVGLAHVAFPVMIAGQVPSGVPTFGVPVSTSGALFGLAQVPATTSPGHLAAVVAVAEPTEPIVDNVAVSAAAPTKEMILAFIFIEVPLGK